MDKKEREIADMRKLLESIQKNAKAKIDTNLQEARERASIEKERKKQKEAEEARKKQRSVEKASLNDSD